MTEAIPQGTPEWKEARRGRLTASRFQEAIATLKSGDWGASRFNYMADIIAERLTGVSVEGYTNAAMQWGIDNEPKAKAAYAFRQDSEVQNVGFVIHPKIAMSGASCDSLVGKIGMAEYKCPLTATHLDYLDGKTIDLKYCTQMEWQLACRPERKWCDFVSFDPRLPERIRLFVKRFPRDDKRIADLEREACIFLGEIESKITRLEKQYGKLR